MSMLPELGADFGISASAASISVTAYLVPFAALMLVSGTLGERWGRRRAVLTAYLVYVVASLVAVFATWLPLFLAMRVLQGAANAFTTPLLLAVVAGSVKPGALGRALGWFGSLQAAGQTSAPLLGGLAAEFDWRLAFVGVAVAAALLAAVGLPPTARPATRARPRLRSAWRPYVLRIGLVGGLGWGCVAGLNFLVALRLEDAFGLGAAGRGLLLTALGVAGILTARVIGSAVDKVGPRRCVLSGVVLGALVVAGVGLSPAVWLVALLWAFGGVATQLVLVGVNALALGSSRSNQGGATSVVQSFRFAFAALGPVVVTPIYHAEAAVAFLVPAALLLLVGPPTLPRADRGGDGPGTGTGPTGTAPTTA
ncbi:MFS transporter [Pseudonocardia benzenivorans]|uniref:Major facilitator superfamily MFS_1 n=1 Tax=Pseudonocardia dioxanivorans (strain ATCC 55486 / DSM 44775 / JCM 13855 / CB1190) TaxID=675635 RepID=F4CX77_PSEUX|nr:major facilitator superfamily MFS_1 [Pseudonocardia dioxanivorans CB1190]